MWLKEPLVHFLVLGALVFAAYAFVGPDVPADDEIVVTRGHQEHIVTAFTRTWNRQPTQEEFTNLVDDWIREEIAYRESRNIGLDSNDSIIRRRLRQKLEMLAEELVAVAEPTAEDLTAYLEANQTDYAAESVFTFRQVYFSPDRRGDDAVRDAEQSLVLLRSEDALVDPEAVGDPLSLPYRFVDQRQGALAARLGGDFAGSLEDLEPGRWEGPVLSGYGYHLVFVETLTPGRPLTLDEAEREVKRDWFNTRRVRTIDQMYERMRERYTVTVESLAEAPAQ